MAKQGKGQALKTLVAAGTWAWANRDRIAATLQSEPVQQAIKTTQAQRVLAHPNVRRVVEHPQVQAALRSPELQRWLGGTAAGPAQPPSQGVAPAGHEPVTGETTRLGR